MPETLQINNHIETTDETLSLQERHPDWPQLDVQFYFAYHHGNKDMEGIESQLKNADVLLYELISKDDRELQRRQDKTKFFNMASVDPPIDMDDLLTRSRFRGTIYEPIVRGIYGTGKAVGCIDIGETNAGQQISSSIYFTLHNMEQPGQAGYKDVLDDFKDRLRVLAEYQNMREKIMVDNFEGEIARILELRPDLKEKENLKILISMGSAHTTLRHKLADSGIESTRDFANGAPHVYRYSSEVARTYMYGKEPSDDIVKRAFIQNAIDTVFYMANRGIDISSDEWAIYSRRFVSELTDDEMAEIFDLWNNRRISFASIDSVLVAGGMPPLPRTADEVIEANELFGKKQHVVGKAALQAA